MTDRLLLLDYLEQGATVITPNNRLSGEVLQFFFTNKPAFFKEKPRCLPWQVYLQTAYQSHCYQNPQIIFPVLLGAQQRRHLWADILSRDSSQSPNQGLLDEVQEAWSRCQRWLIDTNQPDFLHTSQTRQFQHWVEQFENELAERHAITDDQLVNFLINHSVKTAPKTIIWYCFDDYTPQQQALQQHLSAKGCTMHHMDLDQSLDDNARLYAAEDEENEYQQLTLWIRDNHIQNNKRIGIIVPDLQSKAKQLQRLLQQQLQGVSFNISLGQTLNDFSLVSHALSWLNLGTETFTNHQARLLLYSPFLAGSQTEQFERMQCLQDGKALQEASIERSILLPELQSRTPALGELVSHLKNYPEFASVHEWIDAFIDRLTCLGFPGEYALNSANYQCYSRFISLFDEFRELAFISAVMSKSQALNAFETLVATTIFQPETDEESIQILGLLEASGCVFDSLWVSNMTDECLPQKTKLSPFIPPFLQREQQMPHACPARELVLATKIIERLKNSGTHSVFSYPRLTKDKPNLPCPLLIALPAFSALTPEMATSLLALEHYIEDYRLPPGAHEKTIGGASLLANQAKCPFRAFVTHRLHTKQSVASSDGPNMMERGQITHKVMEILWQNLKNQTTLLAMPVKKLESLIISSIEKTLEPYKLSRKQSFSAPVQAVEQARLRRLVHACLEWEKTRPPFEVEALEKNFSISLAGLNFNLRIDRMDCVASDKKWVIDYKSSLPTNLPFREERPKEPQLLLYALLDEHINTLLFAGLKEGHVSVKGLSEESVDANGISNLKKGESWDDLRDIWQKQLTDLADEYSQGHCPPKPASPAVCQQCDFQSLCRFS